MSGAEKATLLTIDYCDRKIRELTDEHFFTLTGDPEKMDLLDTTIAVWNRLKEHLANGEMITIDSQERIQWWSDMKET
jgi:hypothetical protein